jgi:hypothetical protein
MRLFDFVKAWHAKTLDDNVSWRAYDIVSAVTPAHTQKAFKDVAPGVPKDFQVSYVANALGLGTEDVPAIMGAWWVLRQIEAGKRVRGLKRRAAGGLEPPPATPLPESPQGA